MMVNRVLVGYNRGTDMFRLIGRGEDRELFKIKTVVSQFIPDELSIMSVEDGLEVEDLVGNQAKLAEVFGNLRNEMVADNIEMAEEDEF